MRHQHRSVNLGPFQAMWARPFDAGWFRIFWWGIALADHRVSRPTFTERYSGHGAPRRVFIHIGPWCVRFLRRRDVRER